MKHSWPCRLLITGMALGIGLGICGCASMETRSVLAGPDLALTNLSGPASAARGATIEVIHTTKNIGTLPASSSTSRFYLCTNTVASGSQINQQTVPALAVNAIVTLTNNTFTIPSLTPLGTNYIIGVCGFGITDSNPSNNTNSTPIIITE